jgi:hypothetical protein
LNNLKVDWTQAVFYKTVMSDLSDLADVYYDILAFLVQQELNHYLKTFQILNKTILELLFLEVQLKKKL